MPPPAAAWAATRRSGTRARCWRPCATATSQDRPIPWNRVHQLPHLRLLQPLHPREQGRGLRQLPRPRGPDAGGAAGGPAHHGLVPGVPPGPAPHLRPLEHIADMTWRPAGDAREVGRRMVQELRRLPSHRVHHMPPLKDRYPCRCWPRRPTRWRSLEERRGHVARAEGRVPPGASEPPQGLSRRTLLELAAFGAAAAAGCPGASGRRPRR